MGCRLMLRTWGVVSCFGHLALNLPIHLLHELLLNACPPGLLVRSLVVAKDKIHLLQRSAHGFRNGEVHPDQRKKAENCKEDL